MCQKRRELNERSGGGGHQTKKWGTEKTYCLLRMVVVVNATRRSKASKNTEKLKHTKQMPMNASVCKDRRTKSRLDFSSSVKK